MWVSRPLRTLYRCKIILMSQGKIHKTTCRTFLWRPPHPPPSVVPRKARFACKRCYEGLPELFSAGEGYSLNQILKKKTPAQQGKEYLFSSTQTLSVFGLKSSTDRIGRRRCAGRTHVDVLRRAIAFSVVISAVLYRAINALDVLVAAFVCLTIVHLDDHPFKYGSSTPTCESRKGEIP